MMYPWFKFRYSRPYCDRGKHDNRGQSPDRPLHIDRLKLLKLATTQGYFLHIYSIMLRSAQIPLFSSAIIDNGTKVKDSCILETGTVIGPRVIIGKK